MVLDETDRYLLERRRRLLVVTFRRPHRVLSTCRVNGGLVEGLTHLANHQSCEGVAHEDRYAALVGLSAHAYHAQECAAADLPPTTTALMGTAANMQCAVVTHDTVEDLRVSVVATAGVLGNATRAGDPAAWHEEDGYSRPVRRRAAADVVDADPTASRYPPDEVNAGTIVTLVLLNRPCTPGALVRAATIVTEAKSTALLDLRIASMQSSGLATGTGTDQLAIAAPLTCAHDPQDAWERQWAGAHHTLGELLARSVHTAVTRCLLLQNGLCPELRRDVCAALGRFGCTEGVLRDCARAILDAAGAALFCENLVALTRDPQSAAAAFALAEILDLVERGVLHAEVARESILNQAALLAAAVAVTPGDVAVLRRDLMQHQASSAGHLAALAMVLGFRRKWT
jgi:adenosylcobinamide amidohydrolase